MSNEVKDLLDEYYNSESTVEEAILRSGVISNYAELYEFLEKKGLPTATQH